MWPLLFLISELLTALLIAVDLSVGATHRQPRYAEVLLSTGH